MQNRKAKTLWKSIETICTVLLTACQAEHAFQLSYLCCYGRINLSVRILPEDTLSMVIRNLQGVNSLKKRAVISVNLAVLLFGLAGLFAKWIHQPALVITFGRVFFSSIALGITMLIRNQRFRIADRKDFFLLICAGAILALHWWTFLKAIQLSTVAIGTITFSSFPMFVTFLEPLFFHQKVRLRSVLAAAVILLGVVVTVPELSVKNEMFLGIAVGLVSAMSYAFLTVMNKVFVTRYNGMLTAFYEQAAAAVLLLPFMLKSGICFSYTDLFLLLFLGVVTTALAHTLFISSLKELPAQLAGICSSMETVYGILFALLLLGEIPSIREIVGAVIIVGVVVAAQLQAA